MTACWAPLEIDWATCGPIACALCPATTSFTILARECGIEGNVVVVVGDRRRRRRASWWWIDFGFRGQRERESDAAEDDDENERGDHERVARSIRVGGDVRDASGAARGGVIDVSPSCPPRSLPASPTMVVTSLAGAARTQGARNAGRCQHRRDVEWH